ncbi:low-specificity L-threonine aldolase [Candidatus Viridilinea mediisalina]|uniref:Low-specificity L-threonine aldolase n=1 Tax=Candidatus Viridilinea mediisalina TaxID=2024553 RepID=A0A2A6RNM1_9CHLR|nr:low-specificity L-threonine aldolase [Candidatus Viridilinea mediisalina]PDW04516.1 low-specificity L-threonine aldolase [Candidatus Viridilinea mediisalina]
MTLIDLRSDTVTLPSPAMREAMSHAALGDDVYGEDPTVNQLEAFAADLVGKEAALLVPSGTMGNLSALLSHAGRGQRVICGDECHIYYYEAGGASALGGLIYQTLPTEPDGSLPLELVRQALQPVHDVHTSEAGVLCLENTHNRCGGTALTPAYLAEAHALARAAGVPLHLDGARIFNAAIALNLPVQTLTQHVDTVQFCLSKGLAAPIGSLLAGPAPFIARARRVRKLLGGGMRQAGIIAAAGMVALTSMIERLAEDHANARLLASGLAELPGVQLDLSRVQTNIVRFELSNKALPVSTFVANLRTHGVLMGSMSGTFIRAVTHYGIERPAIEHTLEVVQKVLAE